MIHNHDAPLLSELRWFIVQRWFAGGIVVLGALLGLIWFDWTSQAIKILGVGVTILIYNLVFWTLFRSSPAWLESQSAQRGAAWAQLTLDLICLTLLTAITSGILSPLLGLFVLHMIFASLLLQPPRYSPYVAWALAISLLCGSLWLTGQWPETTIEKLLAVGWTGTLLFTVYITTHITNKMQASHERARAVLAAAPDGVLSFDQTGCIELANPEALRMFMYTSVQMSTMRINQLVRHTHLPELCETDSHPPCPLDDQEDSMENPEPYAIRSDGSTFPIELSFNKGSLKGQHLYTTVIHDITERKNTEEALRKLNEELTKHQDQLIQHEKMVAVGRMAAGVAHEIANPLANMDGLIQLVERNPDRMKSDFSAQLREQVVRITGIVRQLKDFAHPLEADRQRVSLDQLIEQAIEMIRFDPRHRQVSISQDAAHSRCEVNIHLQSMLQVLVNLMINGLDAARNERSHRVTVSSRPLDEGYCCIDISDNGTGISSDDLERIFEPFYTTKPLGHGTGLGLSISYRLVQQEGGRIRVESEEGVGTTVSILLPIAP